VVGNKDLLARKLFNALELMMFYENIIFECEVVAQLL
jgi:hypothetical protein